MKKLIRVAAVVMAGTAITAQQAPTPRTHRLEATPETVAYGYYDAAAKPVLRIASGDIIDVDTLLTNTPRGLERAGVKPEDIQPSLRAIVDGVKDKGPGGHILTGPVYVEGAEPGDALEVRDPVDRPADRLRLQRLQRLPAARTAARERPRASFRSIARR